MKHITATIRCECGYQVQIDIIYPDTDAGREACAIDCAMFDVPDPCSVCGNLHVQRSLQEAQ